MKLNTVPLTERSNFKSKDIDILTAKEITKVISECEEEIFGGYENSKGVYDEQIVRRCVLFAKKIQQEIHKNGEINVILVGAGTSGRLCRLMAKVLTPLVRGKINIIPIIAGGIKALVRAQPNTEDKIEEGVADYLSYTKDIDRSNCFVIGVSCGLSANYVKGALNEANKYFKGKTAIIGFNPIELATVDLGKDIQVLNPIIGPEPIVGSVRMKGGTTTMILIYTLITSSILNPELIKKKLIDTFKNCEVTLSRIRNYQSVIARLINSGSKTLQSGRSIYLLGFSNYGALCIYDAAECPPTFGAKINQVNGYSETGVADLVYYPDEKGEKMAKEIDMNVFVRDILPNLTENDIAVAIRNSNESTNEIAEVISLRLKNLYWVQVAQREEKLGESKKGESVVIQEDWKDHFQKLLFIRSLLVHLSTGSFVLSGKVYENKMIDLRITNKKLFLRAIRIVNHITRKDENDIEKALLRSIYEGAVPSGNNLADHIALSATRENIVPLTILSLVYPQKSLDDLKSMLKGKPIVRKLVISELANLR